MAAAAAGSTWHVRNWIVTGNPVYAFFYIIFGGKHINPEVMESAAREWTINGFGIALYGGEADERRLLNGTVDHVLAVMRRLAGGLARLTWVTSGYGWVAIVAPILVAAPGYFGGGLSFGGLMMVIGAFNQVQQSLRWFVDDFHRIADWRATLLRVMALREALAPDRSGDDPERIELVGHATGQLGFENLTISLGSARR